METEEYIFNKHSKSHHSVVVYHKECIDEDSIKHIRANLIVPYARMAETPQYYLCTKCGHRAPKEFFKAVAMLS